MIRVLISVLLLSGCNNFAYVDNFNYVKGYFIGFPNDDISESTFNDYEYSFANVKVGRGPASQVVLSTIKNGIYEWVSADKIRIYTQDGRIIKTVGLSSDVNYREIDNHLSLSRPTRSFASLYNPDLINQSIIIQTEKRKSKKISYIGNELIASEVSSRTIIPSIKYKVTNKYYIHNGRVIYTEQDIHPNLPTFKIEFYYK